MDLRFNSFLITIFLLLGVAVNAYANPQGESVVAGTATFDRSTPNTLTINTTSNNTIINYNSFSIAANESTRINQPGASSAVLNRVVGVNPSEIYGTLSSNGKIFLVNPNGILFGPNSRVDAPAILASTLDITNDDFLKGNYNFFKNGGNSYIINQGRLAASPGGYIALLSQAVNNQGIILADLGTVALAAGNKMTLALDSRDQISVVIDDAVQADVFGPDGQKMDSAIKNSGTIQANGGKLILTAKVLNNVFDYAVNNSGVVQATSLQNNNGVVEITASGAPVINTGKIQASRVNINVLDSNFINEGQIISQYTAGLLNSGNISLQALNIQQDGLISADETIDITADNVNTTVPFQNTIPSPVIKANQVNITANNLGAFGFPVAIDALNINFNRTSGDIDLAGSQPIGSNVMITGPPDGFGSIIYDQDTNLYLDAQNGSISEAQGVSLSASDLTLTANQNINIEGTLKGNSVILDSINGNTILNSGSLIDASGDAGGLVEVLGNQVELIGTRINASGTNGGGTVLIGGDFQGKGRAANATNVYVSRDSYINADAISQGDGGKAIVWSDGTTQYYGNISANGGPISGNGGFIQVSSAGNLDFNGFVNALATNGKRGTFIIDPNGTSGYAASLATSLLDYQPGQTATILGSGWTPGETVSLILQPNNPALPDITITAVADANGNFFNSSFTCRQNDRGVGFVLTATGQNSSLAAQTMFTDATKTSTATGGNWSATTTWSGGVIPIAGDNVIIANGATVIDNVTTGVALNSLTVGQGTSGILTIGTNTTARTVNITGTGGNFIIAAGGTVNCNNAAVTHVLNIGGNFTNNGTFTSLNGSGSITTNFTGAVTQTIGGSTSTTFNRLVVNGASSVTTLGINTIATTFILTTGTFDPSTFLLTAATRRFTAGTLRVGAATWASNYSFAVTEPAAGIIEYYAAGAQTVNNVIYRGSLTLSGTGIKTLGAARTTIGGNLTLSGTATATTAAALAITRNLVVGAGTTFATGATNTWTLSVTGTTSVTGTLTLANTGTKTFTGNVTVNAGGVWNETGIAAINYAGNLQNNGTAFTANTGVHKFSGTTKTISGTSAIIIPSLTISGTTTNNGTLTVSTTLAGASTLTNGATGTLNFGGSSITPTLTATAVGNTVNFIGATQTVKPTTYNNLTLSGSGAKSMGSGTSVTGNLSIAATGNATVSVGSGLTISVGSLTLGGLGRINGTWGSTISTATHTNNTYFAATTGILNVSTDTRITPTLSVLNSPVTYNGLSQAAIVSGSPGTVSSIKYNGSLTTPTNAAIYALNFTPTDTTSYKSLTGASAGNFIINPKALTITATGPAKVYGTALTAGTSASNFTSSAAVNGETVTGVTLTPDAAGLSATTAAGGGYVVTPSLATGTGGFLESNYAVTYNAFSGTVAKAPLDGTNANAPVVVSPYRITPSAAVGTGLSNYTITYVPGQLTVTPATFLNLSNSQIANSIIPPPTSNFVNQFFNTFNPPPTGVYFYHPLIDIDSGAFDHQFQLDQWAYDFIDGEIQKIP